MKWFKGILVVIVGRGFDLPEFTHWGVMLDL